MPKYKPLFKKNLLMMIVLVFFYTSSHFIYKFFV